MGCQISIVIPTRHNAEVLKRCLASLVVSGRHASDWEAWVVDNSDDERKPETASVVKACKHPALRYVPMPTRGLRAARHYGMELSHGQVVSFIGDDSFVEESWLGGIKAAFSRRDVVLVGGSNRPAYDDVQPPRWVEYFWRRAEFGTFCGYLSLSDFGPDSRFIPATLVYGCNYSIRKEVFYRVNGSHPDYLPSPWKRCQGDGEAALSIKVAALGHQAFYSPECSIRHWVPAARFEQAYWGDRAFFVGLHSSFTRIRAEQGLGPQQGVPPALVAHVNNPWLRIRALAAKTWAGRIKRRLFPRPPPAPSEPEEVASMRRFLKGRSTEGGSFHRKEVESDPALKEYVTRPHYMGENANLP